MLMICNIYFPNNDPISVSNDCPNHGASYNCYSFIPKLDLVFWVWAMSAGKYKYFQIAEMSDKDIYVEEIEAEFYQRLIRMDTKNYFYFVEAIYL